LRLETCSYSSSSLSRLLALSGSLTRLELAEMEDLSAEGGMAALTRLQHLLCWLGSPEAGEAIAAALPHLTGLTCLMLWGDCCLNLLSPALSSLSRLQLCELENDGYDDAGGQLAPLPVGPWLHSLRWLSTNDNTLLRSLPALQAAAAFECISIELTPPSRSHDWCPPAAAAFFDWLARHPPLRRLCLACYSEDLAPLEIVQHLMRLCRYRPDLAIEFPDEGREGEALGAFVLRTDPF
jgi:hypothetical protein